MWCNTEDADYCRDQLQFPDCSILLCVERVVVERGTETLRDVRYFVSSLDAETVTPQQLLGWVRGHWSVENNLHFVKDRWWDEDRHYLRRPGLAERMATLTSCALAFVQLVAQTADRGLRRQADLFAWRPQTALHQLGFK
ncbi:transposase [Lignipirellula cremea]|uniref:transposase n=1 Tax=Lignipirellula cremea TaxID=2528010 RepID=UPI00119D1553|nr:transposase [Lignipirellula cremea]